MSYLLFLDESGHDHRNTHYEVRGGVAIHINQLGPFIRAIRHLEDSCFGTRLQQYGSEIKGHRLLDKNRYAWASQTQELDDVVRRKGSRTFLEKGKTGQSPTFTEFTAYGQASLMMAKGIFQLLTDHRARIFASVIPCTVSTPDSFEAKDFLRKDHVFLFERFYYFLDDKNEMGVVVMDESGRTDDRRFLDRMTRYFTKTEKGRIRSQKIVPYPFFVASDMTYPVQVADVIIYCINNGFRLPGMGMNAPVREEMQNDFGGWINSLQFRSEIEVNDEMHPTFGIVFVRDPYGEGDG